MSIVSYAQNFEDVLLWRALGDVKDGRYIDIGAHDPVVDSVSQAFYEAGWRGMHVEPLPHYAAKLREARPEELVIEAAVTEAAGPIPFYELSGLSSGRADIARHHERSGHVTRKMLVPTVRLDDLLKLIGDDIHWLKIDVEGMEADVLRSWGKSSVRPWVLIVEATFPNTQDPTQHLWLDEVLGRGYEQVFFDGLSCYFVHESHRDLAARFASPANFFDKFSVAKDHFSAALIKAELETSERLLVQERSRVDHLNTELRDLWQTHNGVREEQRRALEQLVAAERDHRAAVDAMLLGRRDLEQREEQLRQALRDAEAALGAARVEVARFEERSRQLQDKLDRADDAFRQAEFRLRQLEQRAAEDRTAYEQARSILEQQLAEMARERDQTERKFEQQVADDRAVLAQTRATLEQQIAAIGGARDQAQRELAETRLALASLYQTRRGKIASWLGLLPGHGLTRVAAARSETPRQIPADQQNSKASIDARHYGTEFTVEDVRHTSSLLALNGSAFVNALYRVFLKRSPDRQGRDHFIGRLQAGHSKEAVLLAIAGSPEAKSIGAPVEGVAEIENAQSRKNWSFFGQARQSRALEARLSKLEYSLGEAHNVLLERLERIETSLDQIQSNLGRASYRNIPTGNVAGDGSDRPPASIKRGLLCRAVGLRIRIY